MAYAGQEDQLVALFSQNLNFQPSPIPVEPTPPTLAKEPAKCVYISQHYTHTAHIARPAVQQEVRAAEPPQRSSSEPPPTELQDLEALLRSHGVDTNALSGPQVDLCRAASDEQKLRLIQLWSDYPPTPDSLMSGNTASTHPALTWSTTTMDQEEALAKRRMEKQMDALNSEYTTMHIEGHTPAQAADGRWVSNDTQRSQIPYAVSYMEPYMMSGYEQMMQRDYERNLISPKLSDDGDMSPVDGCGMPYSRAMDPVYKLTPEHAGLEWQKQQMMENQYGSIVTWRDDEDML